MQIQKPADLARMVKARRQSQGLTQQDVADAVGMTRQSLARIERGHAGASFDLVLRIFEKLGIRLEANSDGQRTVAVPVPTWDVDTSLNASAAARASAKRIDTSDTAASAFKNLGVSAIAAAATAATRNTDTSALLSNWQSALRDQTERLRESAAKNGSQLSAEEARKALFSAAIEAGNPDRGDSTLTSERSSRESWNGNGNG